MLLPDPLLAFLGSFGWPELLVIGILGVLIFGKRLPEVGKSLGKGLVEFKKGLKGIDDEVNVQTQDTKHLADPTAHTGDTIRTDTKTESTPPPA